MSRIRIWLSLVLVVLLWIRPIPAVPAESSIIPPNQFVIQQAPPDPHARFRPWTWLRDTIIESIWNVPKKKTSGHAAADTRRGVPPPKQALTRYGSDIVVRFELKEPAQVEAISEAVNVLFLDVWDATDTFVDIRLAKEVLPSLLGLLPASMQNSYSLLIHDLSELIYASYPARQSTKLQDVPRFSPSLRHSSNVADLFFDEYQPFSVIVPWMRLMASMFPSHVQLINVGMTAEGREIPAFKLGVRPAAPEPQKPRRTILIIGGSHAREWISTSTVSYIAFKLITEYGKSAAITRLLESFDWVLVPTINPDGYIYSWDVDRLWRKNRQPTYLRFCPGFDLDRSWGFAWDGQWTQGNPCSESYAGEAAFDAVEARTIADWAYEQQAVNKTAKFVGFLDLHAYSQQILYPYSYSCSTVPPTLENLEELAFGLAKAIRVTSRESYSVRSACEGIVLPGEGTRHQAHVEGTGGSALDWFYHQMHATYAYQIKLRDRGTYGFLLPPENIVPTGREVFNSVLLYGRFLLGDEANGLEWRLDVPDSTDDLDTDVFDRSQFREDVAGQQPSGNETVMEDDDDDYDDGSIG